MAKYVIHIRRPPTRWRVESNYKTRKLYNPNYKEKRFVRQLISAQVGDITLLDEAVKTQIVFLVPMPKSWSKKQRMQMLGMPMAEKPDLDNLTKFLNDCLTTTVLTDDCLIYSTRKVKLWSEAPGTVLVVETVSPEELQRFDCNGCDEELLGKIAPAKEFDLAEPIGEC